MCPLDGGLNPGAVLIAYSDSFLIFICGEGGTSFIMLCEPGKGTVVTFTVGQANGATRRMSVGRLDPNCAWQLRPPARSARPELYSGSRCFSEWGWLLKALSGKPTVAHVRVRGH